ncbi:MAG: 50S ribosomal protein L1 [Candidatus Omnitrophica bacterium]|nr:50S ribosomal protein L1 [Candidatus Omnitrophota bacterium]
MVTIAKKQKEIQAMVDKTKRYDLKDAVSILKKAPKAKFDESMNVDIDLNIDAKAVTQPIRGTVSLPHGTGKKVRVCCICKGEDEKKAQESGADFVGSSDLVAKIAGGWCDFDVAIATPDMMKDLSKLGKVLGPKGLMPNPKSGTVTTDVAKTIKEIKAGKIEYKMDKQAGIHVSVGKISFDENKLYENARDFITAVISANPSVAKPGAIASIAVSKTMGPGMKLELGEFKR